MDQCLNLLNEALSSECFQPRKLNCQMWLKASNKLIHHRGPGARDRCLGLFLSWGNWLSYRPLWFSTLQVCLHVRAGKKILV